MPLLLTSLRRAIPAATLFATFAFSQTCYYPDGSQSTDVPCDPSSKVTWCCDSASFCLSGGLCLKGPVVMRGSCTDSSWESDQCGTFCNKVSTGADIALTPCSSGSESSTFVCGVNNNDCKDDSKTFSLSANDISPVLRPSQIVQLAKSALASTQVTVTVAPNNAGLYTAGTVAGVGAGLAIPLLLALGIAIYLFIREKRRGRPKSMYKIPDEPEPEPKEDFTIEPPPPIRDTMSHRDSHASGMTSGSSNRRASLRTIGTTKTFVPPRPPHVASMAASLVNTNSMMTSNSFIERFETMKKNMNNESKVSVVDVTEPRHELDSTPTKEVERFELGNGRMST